MSDDREDPAQDTGSGAETDEGARAQQPDGPDSRPPGRELEVRIERPDGKTDPGDGGQDPEPDERRLHESIAAEARDRQDRDDSLRDLFGNASVDAGRDVYGDVRNTASEGGTIFQGSTFNFTESGDGRCIVTHLRIQDANELLEWFVPSASQENLEMHVDTETVVFLRGAEGTGRRSAARAALLNWVRKRGSAASPDEAEEHVGEIRLPRDKVDMPELRRGHGYLLEPTSGDSRVREIDHLSDLAVRNECRLVVVIPPKRTGRCVIDHVPASDQAVFRRWLHHAASIDVDPGQLAEVEQTITARLDGEHSPSLVAAQARQAVHRLWKGHPLASVVEDLLDELTGRLREDIRRRIDTRDPVLGGCFMAAVAALHGCPEMVISRAAMDLAERIDEDWKVHDERRTRPIWEELQSWLHSTKSTARPSPRPGDGRTLLLDRPRAPGIALKVLWEEHPTIREALIEWLRRLTEHPDSSVQTRAAHVVGMFATLDFDTINTRFLGEWSDSRSSHDHRRAALVLEAAAYDVRLKDRVHAHLRDLASSVRYGHRAVAVRAYGSRIGLEAPDEALRVLRSVSVRLNRRLDHEIAVTVANLCHPGTAPAIVGELSSWVTAESDGGRYSAALAFGRLAAPWSAASVGPALAGLCENDHLVQLWQNALRLRIASKGSGRPRLALPDAWDVFCAWVRLHDERPDTRAVVDRVAATVDARELELYLRFWRRRRRISQELYSHLMEISKGATPCS
ncbi:hypothetical protein Airi02_069570 [Actinoallomurus iriomotensis]|uniref:Uncharacterized protein n=1 Tax=Actinoallomurus iriomotensis TaxID=478107 RepID=A0A9W6S8I0_9ACTN|nr:hypothetical protein Airi02_069570 [Actinoallomurus iriomotensis]